VHEFAHFGIVYAFQLENFLRFINGSNFMNHKFIGVWTSQYSELIENSPNYILTEGQ